MFVIFLWSFAAFAASTAAIYLAILMGTAAAWQLLGIRDTDGGGMMALGLVIAPAIAIPLGLVAGIVVFLRKRRRARGDSTASEGAHDRRRFIILGAAILGWLTGLYIARFGFWLASPIRYDTYLKALAHAWLPDIAGIAGAFAAGFIAARAMRK